jgi:hypothetical protein
MILCGKFKLRSREGLITFREGDVAGELEWKMLVGDLDLVIYGDRCRWTAPDSWPMLRAEVKRLAQELADDMRVKIDLAYLDGSEILAPQLAC